MCCRSVCIWRGARVVAAIHPCDSEPWCCVGRVSQRLEGATIGCGPTCNQTAVRAEAATHWLLARCMSRMKCQTPGRWETPTISHPAHGALQTPPPPPLSPLNHIQSILCFFAFFPSLIHNKDGLQKERTTSQLVHRRSHFSDEAANLFDKLETPPPPSPSPRHQRE